MFLEKRKNNIKGAMKAKKLTQKKMAKRLKLSESYITRLLDGTRYNKRFEKSSNFSYVEHRIAEHIWRKDKKFSDLVQDLTKLVENALPF